MDFFDEDTGAWSEAAIENHTTTPADLAAFRIDFDEWMRTLPRRTRAIANRLAVGDRTGEVAKRYDVSSGRISQIRARLRDAWEEFQGESADAAIVFG